MEGEEEEEITHHQQHSSSSSSSNNKLEEPTTTTTTPPLVVVVEENVVVTDDRVVAEMEKILNYRFRNKNLLNEALSQCASPRSKSCSMCSATSLSERIQFQRLEFLGDAALGLAVASFIFINFPGHDDYNSNYDGIYKQNTSNEKLACVAIQHGFYRYIRRLLHLSENTRIRDFALVLQEARNGVLSSADMKTPKFLADLVESIAGALYVDCDFDLKLFWKCFGPLLEPCVTPASLYLPEILELFGHCRKAGKQALVRYERQGSQNMAAVYVNGHFVCSSYSKVERIAKVNAASKAMKLLKSTSDDHNWKFNTQKKKKKKKRVVEGIHVEKARPICFKLRVRVEKEDSEDKAIKEKLEQKRNQLVETKKRKRETGSEVSAEKVERDMAIDEKLEKKSNRLVGTKKRKMENVSAEKVEQLFAEENSSMKNITCQSNIRENSKKYAPIYTSKHMDTSLSLVAEVEEILGYRFRNKSLLKEALTHFSYRSSSSPTRERLEFVGVAVLSLALSNFLFITYPDLEPHQLTHLRDANMNPGKLARVAIRHGFYRYSRYKSPFLDTMVRDFARVVQKKGDGVGYGGVVKPPLILVTIVRSIAAAIFVDCEFDFKLLWKYFCGLLEPLVTLDTFQQQPVHMLYELCQNEGKDIDVKYHFNESQYTVSFNVNGQLVGSGCSKNKFFAKNIAAREALKLWNVDSTHVIMDFGAKHKLNELCIKNGWKMPTYTLDKEGTPPDIKYICEVQIETAPGSYLTATGVHENAKASSTKSAASMMLHDLEKSEHGLVKSP